MGLRDDVQRISFSIDRQNSVNSTKSQQKYKIENDLIIKLEYYLMKYKRNNKNIYDINVQDEIIQKTLKSKFGDLLDNVESSDPVTFVENYRTEDERVDYEYYYIFLQRHYLQAVRNIERYLKNTEEAAKEQQQIKTDILYIKREQEAEKLKRLQNVNSENTQQQQIATNQERMRVIATVLMVLFLPAGLILWGFLSAANKHK